MRKLTTQQRIKSAASYNDSLFSDHKVSVLCFCYFQILVLHTMFYTPADTFILCPHLLVLDLIIQ